MPDSLIKRKAGLASLRSLVSALPRSGSNGVLIQIHPNRYKKTRHEAGFLYMAVGQGFEPWDLLQSTVFKTAAFDHSATPPICPAHYTGRISRYKGTDNFFKQFNELGD